MGGLYPQDGGPSLPTAQPQPQKPGLHHLVPSPWGPAAPVTPLQRPFLEPQAEHRTEGAGCPRGLRQCAPPQWSDHRRGHLPPLRMALTVETRDNRRWPGWRERGALGAGGRGEAAAAVADSSREGPQSFRTKLK